MTDVLEPTAGRPCPPSAASGSRRRFSKRSKAIAASLSLVAAGVAGSLANTAAPAQAEAVRGDFNIAVVIPWNRIGQVHSFSVEYLDGGLLHHGERVTSECFTDVQFTDAMNYWSTPYTTGLRALDPSQSHIAVQYFENNDCTSDPFAQVVYPGDSLVYGKKYVYTYTSF